MKTLTMSLTKWRLIAIFIFLPFFLVATPSKKNYLKPTNLIDCPTTDLILPASESTPDKINDWLTANKLAFEASIRNLGGLWNTEDLVISNDYDNSLPQSVCEATDGGLLVIFKATNSEKDVIRCGADLILLDDELIIPEEEEVIRFNSSNSIQSSIDAWLVTYPVTLRNQLEDGPSREKKEDLIITNDYNGTLPNWVCKEELNNELAITFTVEDRCGNIATRRKKIIIEDNLPPKLAILSPIEVERRESFSPENIGYVAASDECTPAAEIRLDYIDDFAQISKDTILRTWIATDLCGNSDSIIQLIKLVDRITFLEVPCAPGNLIISCRGNTINNAAINSWNSQNLEHLRNVCGSSNTVRQINSNFTGGANCGQRTDGVRQTYMISDSLGNSTIRYAYIKIIDNIPPILPQLPNSGVTINTNPFLPNVSLAMSNYHTRALQLGNGSFDAQCSNVQLRNDNTYFGNPDRAFPHRRYLRYIFDYRDDCGNRSVLTPSFFIQDTFPPNVTCEPLDMVLTCLGDTKNEVAATEWNANNMELLAACARDQYFETTIRSDYNFIELSGKCGESKSKVVTYTISDELGNKTFKTATFSIEGGANPCGELDIQTANNQLIIINPIVPNSIIKVFDKNYQIISTCTGDCPTTITIPDLPTGEIYHTDIQFYDENWQFICEDKRTTTIFSDEPCDTSACQGNVTLRTQEEVDAFCGCEEIEGTLFLREVNLEASNSENATPISDISVFSNLKRIKGSLLIWNTEVEDLSAFSNLVEIERSLNLFNNQNLNNLSGLNSLTKVGDLSLRKSPNIQSLQGLENVLIEKEISIIENPDLIDIEALIHIENLNEDISIQENPLLQSLKGLENIKQLRNLVIKQNSNLSDCCSVANLLNYELNNRIIDGYIDIADNPQLCDTSATILLNCITVPSACEQIEISSQNNHLTIKGLTAPNTIVKVLDENGQLHYECTGDCPERVRIFDLPIGEIYQTDIQFFNKNWQLLCEAQQEIEIIGSEPCDTSICNTNITLETQAEIDAFCGCEVIDGNLRIGTFGFVGTPDPTSAIFDLSRFHNLRKVTGQLTIGNVQVNNLSAFDNVQEIGGLLQITYCPQLETIASFNQIEQIESVIIERNNNLTTFDAFENLVQIEKTLSIRVNPKLESVPVISENTTLSRIDIWSNDSLKSIDFLSNIERARDVSIGFNNALKSLEGLGNLKAVEENLGIINNATLTSVNALSKLDSVKGRFAIAFHKVLENIDGLTHLKHAGSLLIYDNPLLNYCCAVEHLLDEDLDNGQVNGEIRIRNNSTECSSAAAVLLDCQPIPLECEIESVVFECQEREANRAAAEAWHQENIDKLKANCLARDSGMIIVSSIVGIDDAFSNYPCGVCTISGYYEVIDTVGETTFEAKRATFEIVDTRPPTVTEFRTHDTIECRNFPDLTFGWLEGTRFNLQGAGSIERCSPIKVVTYQHFPEDLSPDNPSYLTTRNVFTLKDGIGNSNDTSITIFLTIIDTIAPTVTCEPIDVNASSQNQAEKEQLAINWNQENIALLKNCSEETCSSVSVVSDFDFNNLSIDSEGQERLMATYTIADDYNNVITKMALLSFEKESGNTPCDFIEIELTGNQLNINNLSAPNTLAKIFDQNWQIIFNCAGDCPETVSATNLVDGNIYHTDVQFYDKDWNFICEDKQDILLESGISPCDTSVCQGDVVLRTQADVDAFCGCEVIEGDLRIGNYDGQFETDIDNLQKLTNLKKVGGNCLIVETKVKDINSLLKLEYVGKTLTLVKNLALDNIEGLQNIKEVNENLVINGNPKLTNLDGLNQLTRIGQRIQLEQSENLLNIDGLSNLSYVGGISLEFCPIESVTAFSNIQNSRLRDLNIINCDNLKSLNGLEFIDSTDMGIILAANDLLEDINALRNVSYLGGSPVITSLIIDINPKLSECCAIVHLIDDDASNGIAAFGSLIRNNALFCNSKEEILQNCQNQPTNPCETTLIQTTNSQLGISNLTAPIEIIKVFDSNYATVYECFADCEETINLPDLAAGIYHININAYDENWQHLCERVETVQIQSSTQNRNSDFAPTDFALFPNPASTATFIDLSKLKGEKVELALLNQFGQQVSHQVIEQVSEQVAVIDLATIQNGLYILKIKSKNRKAIAKKLLVSRLY